MTIITVIIKNKMTTSNKKLITYYVFFISAFIKFIMRYDKNILLDILLSIEKGSFCLDK